MVLLLSLLLTARPALAWEQLYLSSELTFTLGARRPLGFAVSAQLGEAPVKDVFPPGPDESASRALDFRAVAEVAYGPNGLALSLLGRAGFMTSGQFGYTSWWYFAGPETYTEVGATFRPSSWSGLRLGGGVSVYVAALRYHQLVPLRDLRSMPPATLDPVDSEAPLPLPARHPGNLLPYDMKIAVAFEPWMLPGPLRGVY